MKWNERITVAREALGINKAEFARRVGVSSATTADWETGQIKMIDGAHLVKVSHVLKVTAEWIMTGSGSAEADKTTGVVSEFAWLYHHTTEDGRSFLCNAVKAAGKAFVEDDQRKSNVPVLVDRRKR